MERYLKYKIAAHRRSGLIQYAAKLSQRFLNAYHYTGEYEFDSNGEKFAIDKFVQIFGPRATIWDVGAHLGEYALQAHETMPDSQIISFEIVPEIAEKLKRKISGDWFSLQEVGLSDSIGEVDVSWNRNQDTTNSVNPFMYQHIDQSDIQLRRCPVTTVDQLVAEGIARPDLLKIDVEGHEKAVLLGARNLLGGSEAPTMIQFEYGGTWIPSSVTLYSVQTYLESFGYSVGRLYPDHVEFKDYSWYDEHFRMGNMIATNNEKLRHALANAS